VVLEENISKLPHPNFVSTLKFTQGWFVPNLIAIGLLVLEKIWFS
jgi:hypothetical protein